METNLKTVVEFDKDDGTLFVTTTKRCSGKEGEFLVARSWIEREKEPDTYRLLSSLIKEHQAALSK